ncbi:MAG: transglutaminase-like domain-containing protein, partial [Chloroflexota bacterium]|nr:transglutaminase-like domain-containing protein [Chloroflexota bacterium]
MARLRLREGWMTFLLLAGTIFSVTWAIQRARWTENDLAFLTPIALGGLLTGLALAKWRRLPPFVAHPIGLAIGCLLILDRLDPLLPLPADGHGLRAALGFLVGRARTWFAAAGTDQYTDDFYLFLFGLAAIGWVVAYGSTWMLFRSRWIWPALLLPATVLLLNLGYAPVSLSSALVLFLLCALLLVVRFQMAVREEEWRRGNVAYPESLGWRALWVGLVVVTLTVGFAWVAPFSARNVPLQAAWDRMNGPWQRLESRFNQRFPSLNGRGARGVGNYAAFGERFRLGGPLKLSQTPILALQADQPYYLKVRSYDLFDGQQWDSDVDATFNPPNNGQSYAPQLELQGGQELSAPGPAAADRRDLTVRMLAPRGGGLFTAGQFVSASQDSFVQLSWTQFRNQTFDLAAVQAENLPPDLRRVYGLLHEANAAGGLLRDTDPQGNPLPPPTPTPLPPTRAATPGAGPPPPVPPVQPTPTPSREERAVEQERASLAARLLYVRPIVRDGQAVGMVVNGQVPNYGDVEVVLPQEGLQRGAQYRTTILASRANAPQLRDAGGAYPEWVTQRYLQLPASTTQRTRDRAQQIAGDLNPYDAAVAIQNWLRENIEYNENINFPPPNRDVVDYLLFDSRQGYCEYYSTAMVVMLRSLGIPAREAVGLFSGEWDNDQLAYLYRESNAHAWPEVYFPGYGWIAFEPTSPRPAFEREPAVEGGDPGDPNAAPGDDIGSGELFPDDPAMGPGLGGGATLPTETHPVLRVLRVAVPLLLLTAGLLAALWLAGLRGLSPSGQFYARMTRSAALAGVRPPRGAT